MFTGRGWSYSGSRRRRTHGAYRAQRRTAAWLWFAPALVLAIALGGLLLVRTAPAAEVAAESALAPTPVVEALLALPKATLAPTPVELPTPTAVPTVAPTAVPLKGLLPDHRIVAYYGNPLAKQMGILGELAPEEMLGRLKQQIATYSVADGSRPIVPALELVTPAAQGWPGEDGLYRARMKPALIDQVGAWADANNGILILDVQIGLSSVPEEVEALMPYLKRPNVHLALDPEFAISDGHIPGEVIGSLDGATIDGVVRTLSDLVAAEHLPPKILIVHRFTDSMVTNAWEIAPNPNVQVVVTMDGFGPPALKLAQYRSYVHDQGVEYSGIKLFYHHDVPLLSPAQVLGLDPQPDLVIYQ
jgi:hypothetical protein